MTINEGKMNKQIKGGGWTDISLHVKRQVRCARY